MKITGDIRTQKKKKYKKEEVAFLIPALAINTRSSHMKASMVNCK